MCEVVSGMFSLGGGWGMNFMKMNFMGNCMKTLMSRTLQQEISLVQKTVKGERKVARIEVKQSSELICIWKMAQDLSMWVLNASRAGVDISPYGAFFSIQLLYLIIVNCWTVHREMDHKHHKHNLFECYSGLELRQKRSLCQSVLYVCLKITFCYSYSWSQLVWITLFHTG